MVKLLAVFSCGGVVALGAYGGRWVGRSAGLAAAGLLLVSVHHVGFSQEARGYSGLLLLTIASVRSAHQWMDRSSALNNHFFPVGFL